MNDWHVLGAGAMGCLYAHALSQAGLDTTLLQRGDSAARPGEVIARWQGRDSRAGLRVAGTGRAGAISRLLVTTKAYDVHDAVASVAGALRGDAALVLLVNGMGLAEKLRADHPGLDVICATSTEGAYRLAPLHVCHAGRGDTLLGRSGAGEPPAWFDDWSSALPRSHWLDNIDEALWAKLAVNCVINPLTALHDCRNGELARRRALLEQTQTLCAEISQVSYAAGFTATAQDIEQSVAAVIAGTAANHSSMLQDVRGGRRTEIDYINGYLLKVADEHGIPAPHNRALLEAVKDLER